MPQLQTLACPGVVSLVSCLAFSSQYLFLSIEPGPLRKGDAYLFNALVLALLFCYARTCLNDPGTIPQDWQERLPDDKGKSIVESEARNLRFCRKCDAPKPPRAHHCRTCKRCIPKMDHHCVWTANCVSHITFPHFIRFLFYAVSAMAYLEHFLYLRCAVLWSNRNLPSYLGPSMLQMAHLFILVAVNSLVLFALAILLGRALWGLAINVTTIEAWEIERHHALLRRAKALGGHLNGPDGSKIRIQHQEFPWDIGIWANICQGMGSRNPLAWLWPFASSPSLDSGLAFEHNGIEDPSKPWPPPDPDRMFRVPRPPPAGNPFTKPMDVESFRQRQAADMARYVDGELVVRRRPFHERYQHLAQDTPDEDDDYDDLSPTEESTPMTGGESAYVVEEGEEAWRNNEGERLADFGLDEDVEFYDEDDLPLSALMQKKKEARDLRE